MNIFLNYYHSTTKNKTLKLSTTDWRRNHFFHLSILKQWFFKESVYTPKGLFLISRGQFIWDARYLSYYLAAQIAVHRSRLKWDDLTRWETDPKKDDFMDAVNSNITLIQTRTNIDVFMFEMSLRDFRILCGKIVNWRKSSPANFWYSLLLYFLHDIYNLFKISAQCSLHHQVWR